MGKSTIIVGLDIGTTKICAVMGELLEDGSLEIIGIGTSKSTGMRKGMVVNIEQTVQSIRQAVEAAQTMSGQEITSVYAGIAGSHITSVNRNGMIKVKGESICQKDVERVIDVARALPSAEIAEKQIIHTLPQEFIVDNQRGIIDPLGMVGNRLEVNVHIVIGALSSAQNIIRSCHRSNLEVADLTLQALASAKSVLTQEEREIGVALVDLGGGTTDIAIFANNTIKYTTSIPVGGQHLTNDIAVLMKTPLASAEKIKINYGCALLDLVQNDEFVEVPSVGGRPPRRASRMDLAQICEPRMAQILSLVDDAIEESSYKPHLGAGIVLTGGASLIDGCLDLADDIFGITTRIGYPRDVSGLKDVVQSPKFATAVGLLRYGAEMEATSGKKKYFKSDENGLWEALWERIVKWFKEVS